MGLPKAPWEGLCAKVLQGVGKERDTVNRGGRQGRSWGEWVLSGDGAEMEEGGGVGRDQCAAGPRYLSAEGSVRGILSPSRTECPRSKGRFQG